MNDSHDLTIAAFQGAVHAWISQWDDGYWHPLSNLARLTEELGELARAINHVHGQKPRKASDDEDNIAEELGDVLFTLITLANSLDIDLTATLRHVMHKYDMRDAGRFTPKVT